ncbi:MAG TPA: [protein-PII] uridylyltransferase [bacterium]|nr:[protein-PII] uridylyltransferase [bacterium]
MTLASPSSLDLLPPLSLEGDLLAGVKSYLGAVRERLEKLHAEHEDPSDAILYRTEAMDRLLSSLFLNARDDFRRRHGGAKSFQAALLSQGGYGRRELCLHSDIDVLFLYDGKAQEFIKFLNLNVLQPLWDAGLEVGFAVRTVKDCRKLMDEDMTILTSLIDARHLVGEASLSESLKATVDKYFSSKSNRERFFRLKTAENAERLEKYGGSVYLLEPNLKEGEGGLRDYHTLYWFGRIFDRIEGPSDLVARGILNDEEFHTLWDSLGFLWRLRNELHRRTGRRADQLSVEYQEPIAHWFGYKNDSQFLGVEVFMQKYYRVAANIRNLTSKAIRRIKRVEPKLFPPAKTPLKDEHCWIIDGRLTVASPDVFEKEPIYLLKIFEIARTLGVELDDVAKDRIEKALPLINDRFRKDRVICLYFRDMLSRPEGLGEMLSAMNDSGVLGAFLPEFGKLRFRVQHNLYHVYTVDVHSLFAVTELGKIAKGDYAQRHPVITEIVKSLTAPDRRSLLAFAILYHDVGKGEGKGHVERGAPLIREAARRLHFPQADVEALEFLELSHLIMTHVAFRRDLEEQNLIIQFAKAMQSLELLAMLHVLTFCDVKAANPEAMTDWKAALLDLLYVKTREVLQKGTFTKEKVSELVQRVLVEVLRLFPLEEDREKCREFFAMMSPRYLLAAPPRQIAHHVELWERFRSDPIVFEARPLEKEGLNEVTLLTWEGSTLFSRMAGLFAAHNINIFDAQLNLSNRGHALQVFKVTDHEGRMIANSPEAQDDKWAKLEKDLRDVLQGKVQIEALVAEKFRPSLFRKKIAQVVPARVDIDNDVSAYYTVIDIYSQDRTGLLYQITSMLSALGLYVDVSKISTKLDQAADTFYVKDIFGQKITSQDRLAKIKASLLKVIEEAPTPDWRPPRL